MDEINLEDPSPDQELSYAQSLRLLYSATQIMKAQAATHQRFRQAFEKLAILVRQEEAKSSSPEVKDE